MIPFVQPIMNSTSNAITHIKPSQIMFGNIIDLDENILTTPSVLEPLTDLPSAVQSMIDTQDSLISTATFLLHDSDQRRLSLHEGPDPDLPAGTYVLIQYSGQPPSRLHTPCMLLVKAAKGPRRQCQANALHLA